MNTTIQFTRYLYIKDEVKLSILISLLKKNNESFFWAYEFYHSGFKEELWEFIWKIYYDFYASLNPRFKKFLKENHELWKKDPTCDKIIAKVISNFGIRPWNADVFLLKEFAKCAKSDKRENLAVLLDKKNYEGIAEIILNKNVNTDDIQIISSYFSKKINNSSKDQLLSDILQMYSVKESLKMGKNLYISDNQDISKFKTIFAHYDSSFYPYKILPIVTQYAIDSESMLSLFHLSRDSCDDLRKIYHYNWLYYTLDTPVWANRIQEFEGFPNHEKKDIDFEDDDDLDEFYDHFGYEPDEQKLEVQRRNIGEIKTVVTWKTILEKNLGLFKPDDAFWKNTEKISY